MYSFIQNAHLTQSDPRDPRKIDPYAPPSPDPSEEQATSQSPRKPLKHSPQAASSSQCLLDELAL